MGRQTTRDHDKLDLMQGTLDMLILRTLLLGPMHGHAIACAIERTSEEMLGIDHGSLYPALQRLLQEEWVRSEWGISSNNRKAKFYSLTRAGKAQLRREASRWERFSRAIALIMNAAEQE